MFYLSTIDVAMFPRDQSFSKSTAIICGAGGHKAEKVEKEEEPQRPTLPPDQISVEALYNKRPRALMSYMMMMMMTMMMASFFIVDKLGWLN